MRSCIRPVYVARVWIRLVAGLGLLLAIVCPAELAAGEPPALMVAAASDLQTVMPAIVERFQKATGTAVRVSFGSSGNFTSQIQNGAPFDVFLSADSEYPKRLAAGGFVDGASMVVYANGHLALWTRTGSGVDVTRGLAVLTDPAVKRIAIANPDHAPYGRAAVAALKHEGLYERVQPKLVLGENVSQAAQFAESGNADVGLFSRSLALDPALKARGRFVDVPATSYPPIQQAGVVVQSSRNKAAARRFLAFVRTPEIVQLLTASGFAAPVAR